MEASANAVSREEFTTAMGDVSAKMEALMMTMSQLVQGTAPTTGDGQVFGGGQGTTTTTMLSSRNLSYGALNDVAQRCSSPRDLQHDSEDRCIIDGKDVRRGWRQRLGRVLVGTLIIGAFATAVATFAGSQTLESETQHKEASFARSVSVKDEEAEVRVGGSASTAPLDFSALNFYHIRDGPPGQAYPWLKDIKVIEPHRETILTVTNPSEEHNYRWVLRVGETDEVQASVSGTEVGVILTQLKEHVITLEEVNPTGVVTRHLEETVIVKYVRREIRTLTEVERGELLDSMHQLWVVSNKDGREMYGDNYLDIWTMNKLHHLSGSGYTCDHFHDGVGFLTSHILITNIFERSLQLVNPKLCLPYWDFTIEESSSSETKYDPGDPTTRTPLLDPSWFGTFDPDDQMVKDGRWAYTEIPRVQKDNLFETLRSDVYGKLRSPWNVNQRPYVTRGAGKMCDGHIEQSCAWPTCEIHYNLVKDYDDFNSWSWESMYWPHGPVHFWLGGFLDCAQTYDKIAHLVGTTISNALAAKSFNNRKSMYWNGLWYCEGTVDDDTPPEEVFSSGMCGCLGFDLTQGDDYKTISSALKISQISSDFDDFDEDVQREVISTLCSSVLGLGEHTQSSSSLDPMFWLMHPTMERTWQFSILTGHVTDFTWPDHDITYHGPEQTPVEQSLSLYGETCVGHRGSDVFPFGILESDSVGFDVETGMLAHDGTGVGKANRDVLASLDPHMGNFMYIYDNFKWEHCAADGYNFDDLWIEKQSS